MKRKYATLLAALLAVFLFLSCTNLEKTVQIPYADHHRTYYEIFVRSFYDTDSDGIGDINGVTAKLDYLEEMGITGIWLMPIMPSDSYHKYDVLDYGAIDEEYGTIEDFKTLLAEAEKRNINVIIDLVLNHSAYDHPWFLSARKSLAIAPCLQEVCVHPELCSAHNPYVSYYHFADEKINGQYYSTGMPQNTYYEAVFWDRMPDFNLSDDALKAELKDIARFWLEMGVDGFRLDAVIHFFNENAQQNIAFLREFNDYVTSVNPDAYIVGEAWTTKNTVLSYYDSGIDSLFNFSLATMDGEIIKVIRSGKTDDFSQFVEDYHKDLATIAPDGIDAKFLSNHDNGRSAGFLSANLNYEKVAAAIYLLLPGNPFIYYGEEIGMFGSGRDENKRTPMVWSKTDLTGTPSLMAGAEITRAVDMGVDEQANDENSLLSHYKAVLTVRNALEPIRKGTVESIKTDGKLIAFKLTYEDESVLVLHNCQSTDQVMTLAAETASFTEIYQTLNTPESPTINNGEVIVPPYSSMIITEK